MTDEVIPLDKLGKQGVVKVYNQAYVEKLQKENEKLKNQIEKMKCCGNCEYYHYENGDTWCELPKDVDCTDFDNWELEE